MSSENGINLELIPAQRYLGISRSIARLAAAGSLMDAAQHDPQLRREFPRVVQNYSHLPKAYRRLGYVARLHESGELDAYVMEYGGAVVGMATVQELQLVPLVRIEGRAAEISYWHVPYAKRAVACELGVAVVERLAGRAKERGMTPWMVTLPEDSIKAVANEANEFKRSGPMRIYDIGDGMNERRQLWVPVGTRVIEL